MIYQPPLFILDKKAGGYSSKILALSPTGYWKHAEGSGSVALDSSGNGYNGTYSAGVDLSQPGIGDGLNCATFDTAGEKVDIFGAGFASAFNGSKFSVCGWAKRASWPVGSFDRLFTFQVDVNNFTLGELNGVAAGMEFLYKGSGIMKSITKSDMSTTLFFHYAMTVDFPTDEMKAFINGTQIGTTQTLLPAWVGALTVAQFSGINTWFGSMAHNAYWAGVILTPAQILNLATL